MATSITLSPAELETQYNARRAIPEHPDILTDWECRSERVRATLPCRLDLAYGNKPREKFDLFPAAGTRNPVQVFIHGGYWQRGDKRTHSFLAEALCARGVSVALLGYDLCPAVAIEDIVVQVREAVAWLWRNAHDLEIDERRIQVCGHSAGGHLTAMLMATNWLDLGADLPSDLVQSGLAISGIFELEPLIQTSINDAVGMDLPVARRNSPVLLEPASRAPLEIAVGGLESAEFHRQARTLVAAWEKFDVPVSLLEVPATNHFTIIEQLTTEGVLLERAAGLLGK